MCTDVLNKEETLKRISANNGFIVIHYLLSQKEKVMNLFVLCFEFIWRYDVKITSVKKQKQSHWRNVLLTNKFRLTIRCSNRYREYISELIFF